MSLNCGKTWDFVTIPFHFPSQRLRFASGPSNTSRKGGDGDETDEDDSHEDRPLALVVKSNENSRDSFGEGICIACVQPGSWSSNLVYRMTIQLVQGFEQAEWSPCTYVQK